MLDDLNIEGYVIRNPETGLYSSGGSHLLWKKKPKIWSAPGHLSNHLNLYLKYDSKLRFLHSIYNF